MESKEFDSYITYSSSVDQHLPKNVPPVLHFVGNGVIGMEIKPSSPIYLKNKKVLSMSVPFQPFTSIIFNEWNSYQEANIIQFVNGLAHKVQCLPTRKSCLVVTHQIYAHRTIPSLLVQDIKITNPNDEDIFASVERGGLSKWLTASVREEKVQHGDGDHDYLVISGSLKDSSKQIGVAIVTTKLPSTIEVEKRSSVTLHVYTVVNYSTLKKGERIEASKDRLESQSLQTIKKVAMMTVRQLRASHVEVWQHLFSSGLSISTSKAVGALNGDRINATLYLTLSQVSSNSVESEMSQSERDRLHSQLAYTEGCYGGHHHTLQATRLWSDVSSIEDVIKVTSLWLKTLETQGCHKLVKMGAEGVMQAMLLSFGAWKFSNQHLEFNTAPRDLHRDYSYRRINYGNGTHLNVTVSVLDDNKAALYLALDRSDKDYYACDGGCLDAPVQLGPERIQFPVKLTDPPTAVLYITSDKQHMEDLKHTIHVKEVVEAPAHEDHVLALHKHGNHLGGLPTLFWAVFSLFIILFHLFLFKLIYNEYCGGVQPEIRSIRTRKFSDL